MATKEQKKENLKQQIIAAANAYSRDLAGKTFLYVFGNEHFEVMFPVDRFLHLTGVETGLQAKDFYQKEIECRNYDFIERNVKFQCYMNISDADLFAFAL